MELILGMMVMLCLPTYVVAQVFALLRWPLTVSAVPLLAMGAAFAAFLAGMSAGSNLAPIYMVLVAPFCLVWLGAAQLLRRL